MERGELDLDFFLCSLQSWKIRAFTCSLLTVDLQAIRQISEQMCTCPSASQGVCSRFQLFYTSSSFLLGIHFIDLRQQSRMRVALERWGTRILHEANFTFVFWDAGFWSSRQRSFIATAELSLVTSGFMQSACNRNSFPCRLYLQWYGGELAHAAQACFVYKFCQCVKRWSRSKLLDLSYLPRSKRCYRNNLLESCLPQLSNKLAQLGMRTTDEIHL